MMPNSKHPDHHGRRRRPSLLASCLVATLVLVVVAAVLAAVSFTLLRPHDPTISVSAVRLPAFASRNGTASFTFQQQAAVRNPNRSALSHYDSTLQVSCAGQQVAFMFIPAGEIAGGGTQYMATSMPVGTVPLGVDGGGKVVVVETRMRLKGRVRLLRFLTHRVEATASCRVGISPADGSILGFHCL